MTTLTDLLAHTPHDHVERKSLMNAQHQLEDLSRQMHDEVGLRPLRSSDFSSIPRQASAASRVTRQSLGQRQQPSTASLIHSAPAPASSNLNQRLAGWPGPDQPSVPRVL